MMGVTYWTVQTNPTGNLAKLHETTAGSNKLRISKFWGTYAVSIYPPTLKKETHKELVLSEYKELQETNSEECG